MENEIKDGGAAFPGHNPNYDGNWDKRSTVGGMSLRDYFAGKLAAGDAAADNGWGIGAPDQMIAARAKFYYRVADAMLAVREGKA